MTKALDRCFVVDDAMSSVPVVAVGPAWKVVTRWSDVL